MNLICDEKNYYFIFKGTFTQSFNFNFSGTLRGLKLLKLNSQGVAWTKDDGPSLPGRRECEARQSLKNRRAETSAAADAALFEELGTLSLDFFFKVSSDFVLTVFLYQSYSI